MIKIINICSQFEYLHGILQETIMDYQIHISLLYIVIYFVKNPENNNKKNQFHLLISQDNHALLHFQQSLYLLHKLITSYIMLNVIFAQNHKILN